MLFNESNILEQLTQIRFLISIDRFKNRKSYQIVPRATLKCHRQTIPTSYNDLCTDDVYQQFHKKIVNETTIFVDESRK